MNEFAFAKVTNIDEVVRPLKGMGLEVEVTISGNTRGAIETLHSRITQQVTMLGAEVHSSDYKDGKQFGFNSKRWNAPWQPRGPKPPWSENPQNN